MEQHSEINCPLEIGAAGNHIAQLDTVVPQPCHPCAMLSSGETIKSAHNPKNERSGVS